MLESFSNFHPWLRSQDVLLSLPHDQGRFFFRLSKSIGDHGHGRDVGNCVSNADREPMMEKPEVDHVLYRREEISRRNVALLTEDHMDETVVLRSCHSFDDCAMQDLAILDQDVLVGIIDWRRLAGVEFRYIDTLRNAHADQLFPSPHGLRLQDSRSRNCAIPVP